MPAPCVFCVMLCALISSSCKGEDEGEGPYKARDYFRARFKILRPIPRPLLYGRATVCGVSSGARSADAMAVKFLRSGQKWCCPAWLFTKTIHVKRFLVQENERSEERRV